MSSAVVMELPTSIDMASGTPPKPAKLTFCDCIKLDPFQYVFHHDNFLGSAFIEGFYLLFVADQYGWIEGMVHNVGGVWYDYLYKIALSHFLVALVLFWLSLAFVCAMRKRLKFLFPYVGAMFLLHIVVALIIAITAMVRYRGTWLDLKNRLGILGIWGICLWGVEKCFFQKISAEEMEKIRTEAAHESRKPSA